MSDNRSLEERFWTKVLITGGCWEWQAGTKGGRNHYGAFTYGYRSHRAHRVAWELERGPIPPGMQVCHRCDNQRCVNPDHLFLGTHADNMADKVAKGRQVRGERLSLALQGRAARGERSGGRRHPEKQSRPGEQNGSAKLTAQQVMEIRASGLPKKRLAREYGVTATLIRKIQRGDLWKHVGAA